MSLHSGEEFPFFDNFEGCCTRLDLGCIVLLSQHSFLFSLSELLWHFMLYFFSSFSHPALLAPCIILNNSDFLSFLCLSLHSCFLDILRPWSMSAPVLCVCNKWIRSVLVSGYENPFLYVDKSLSVFDSRWRFYEIRPIWCRFLDASCELVSLNSEMSTDHE
jgi:hypothetical protein